MYLSTIRFLGVSSFMFSTITSGGWFNLILVKSHFSSWVLESSEVDMSTESSTTLGVSRVQGDASSCSSISWTFLGLGGRISLGISLLNFSEPFKREVI